MKRFVFRAQTALELRLKQEEDAKRLVALAQSRALEARQALEDECRKLDEMMARGGKEAATGDEAVGTWYRNWAVGQRARIERCREELIDRTKLVDQARAVAIVARRKAKSLERFRERAWQRHGQNEAREEQKMLDEHGAMRFALAMSRGGSNT